MISAGRADDPRQWVQAAYLLLDAVEGGLCDPGKLPTQARSPPRLASTGQRLPAPTASSPT